MVRTEQLRSELDELNQRVIDLVGEQEVPQDEISKMADYNTKLDLYIEHLKKINAVVVQNHFDNLDYTGGVHRSSTPFNSIINDFGNMSISHESRPIKMDQLPNFDGKFAFWNSYKIMIENLLINNTSISEDLKKSMLLKTMKNDPEKFVTNLIGQRLSLAEIWSKVCVKFDDPQRAILEIKKDLESIPRIESENDVHNLKKTKEIVEGANLAVKNLNTDAMFYTINLIQAVAAKFYYKSQRHMLAKIRNFEQLVDYIDKLYDDALHYDYNKIRKDNVAKKPEPPKRSNSTAAISMYHCLICEKFHRNNFECLKDYDVKTAADLIKTKRLCFKCLKKGHVSKNCHMSSKLKCDKCPRQHATEMHDVIIEMFQTEPKVIAESRPVTEEPTVGSTAAISFVDHFKNVFDIEKMSKSENRPLLYGSCNGFQSRMLLDNGSDISLIDEDLVIDNPNDVNKKCTVYSSSPLGGTETSRRKISLEIRRAAKKISIDLFPIKMYDKNLVIIGTDNLSYFYDQQPDFLEIPTIFGTIRYKARRDFANVCNVNMCIKPNIDLSNNENHTDEPIIEHNEIIESSDDESVLESEHELLDLEVKNELNMDEVEVDDDIKIERKDNGRYEARLPFLSDLRPKENFDKALMVLDRLIKRLVNKGMKDEYEKQLLAYVNNDQAVEVTDAHGYFLPHHPVFRESASTPLRVVFNGSFGLDALNQSLWKGNAHGLDVFDHLIKFRKGKYAVTADLSKAFLQVLIHPDDQRYLKFMWKNSNNELKIYQMKVLPFGLISSPAILTNVTKKLLSDHELESIAKSIYMDDIIWATDSEAELVTTVQLVKDCFQSSGFAMHKVHTNNAELSSRFESDYSIESKVLGTVWNVETDEIKSAIPSLNPVRTKRDLLSVIGKFFDPYGYLDPWKLRLRLIYRTVIKSEWDDLLSDEIISQIDDHVKDVNQLSNLKLQRYLPSDGEIHGFSDASANAYGYVIYVKKDHQLHYLFGKSKLTPCKVKTIVELELLALYELSKILYRIHSIFQNKISIWSDSMINLHRFKLSPNSQNRNIATQLMKTMKIINDVDISIRHIEGRKNPADLFSRIVNTKQFLKSIKFVIDTNDLDFSDNNVFSVYRISSITVRKFEYSDQIEEFEQLESIDQIIDFVEKLLPKGNAANDRWNLIHRFAQYGHDSSKLDSPFIEGDIIKLKTRDPEFSPIWIPKESRLAIALIKYHHEMAMHGGIKTTMASIQSIYYIPNLYHMVKKYIYYCKFCQVEKRKPVNQPFAPLPSTRTSFAAPFQAVCIDFFGPLRYRNGKKFYGLLVTCLVSRMIKIEVVNSLNAKAALTALNNIFLLCGTPLKIYSDNGTNLVRCEKEIRKFFDYLEEISKADNRRIEWIFSPPNAPWYNGTAERLIAVVKRCLRTFDNEFKSIEDARSIFLKVESTINGRPLIQNDERWLSPFEIAYGRKQNPLIKSNVEIGNANKWNDYLSSIRMKFEKLWRQQYLNSLNQRNPPKAIDIKPGNLVLIPADYRKRTDWPLARIIEVFKSKDGVVRSAKLKFLDDDRELLRPVNGIVSLNSAGECCEVSS